MSKFEIDPIIDAFKKILPKEKDFTPLHEPSFSGNEWEYVKECLDTGWVSSVGKYVDRFEKDLSEFTGAKYVVVVVNGTAALHVAMILMGVQRDDEVLIPDLTFIATANAASYCGAIPHFVDIEEKTLGLDPLKLKKYLNAISEQRSGSCFNKKTGRRIKAVVPMHTFGHPVDMDLLMEVCQEFNLELIEDAAESLGSYYKGKHTGTMARVGTLSFNGNKVITTGGGGAILMNDEELAKKAKHLTTTAKVPHKWSFAHDLIGFNYRLPNINAALGCAQLENLPTFIQNKRKLAKKYSALFKNLSGVHFFTEPDFAKSNYWLNVLLLDKEHIQHRETLLNVTNSQGIMTRPAWTLMHKLEIYKNSPRMENLDCALDIESRLINIPSSASLGKD